MTKTTKPEFVDYILKRWPLLVAGFAACWWVISNQYENKSALQKTNDYIERLIAVAEGRQEIVNVRFAAIESRQSETDRKVNDIEKWKFRTEAVLSKELKTIKDIE